MRPRRRRTPYPPRVLEYARSHRTRLEGGPSAPAGCRRNGVRRGRGHQEPLCGTRRKFGHRGRGVRVRQERHFDDALEGAGRVVSGAAFRTPPGPHQAMCSLCVVVAAEIVWDSADQSGGANVGWLTCRRFGARASQDRVGSGESVQHVGQNSGSTSMTATAGGHRALAQQKIEVGLGGGLVDRRRAQ